MPLTTCDPKAFEVAYQNFSRSSGEADIEANGDVSGPGVLAGFFGTGWLVTVLAICYYVVDREVGTSERSHDGTPAGSGSFTTVPLNAFDEVIRCLCHRLAWPVRGYLKRFLPFGPGSSSKNVSKALEKCILTLCDVQIVTGLGVMTAGYISAATSDLSVYHWQLIVNLAWFSNITHQAALILLQDYLRLHSTERMWRFCLMTILALLLLIALAPMTFQSDRGCGIDFAILPVHCLHHPGHAMHFFDTLRHSNAALFKNECTFAGSEGFLSAMTSAFLLIFSYTRRSIALFASSSSSIHTTLKGFLAPKFQKSAAKLQRRQLPCRTLGVQLRSLVIVRPVLAFYLLGLFLAELISSEFLDIFWLVASATVGTLRLFTSVGLDKEGEKTWAFGQILPIFLLLGPLLMLAQSLFGNSPPDSPSPAATSCQRCSIPTLGTSQAEQENSQPEIHASQEPQPTNNQQYADTRVQLGSEGEVEKLISRDFFSQSTWDKSTICVMAASPNIALVWLLYLIGSQRPIPSIATSLLLPFMTLPVTCYSMFIYGLLVKGWRHERKASFFALLIAGILVMFPFPASVYLSLVLSAEQVPFGMFALFDTTYLPLVAYFAIIPLVLCVKRRRTKGSQGAPPSGQHGTSPTGNGVVGPQDAGHRYLTSPSLETGGSEQTGRDDMSFELDHLAMQAPPNAAGQTSGR